jgi:hypothetical protein
MFDLQCKYAEYDRNRFLQEYHIIFFKESTKDFDKIDKKETVVYVDFIDAIDAVKEMTKEYYKRKHQHQHSANQSRRMQ